FLEVQPIAAADSQRHPRHRAAVADAGREDLRAPSPPRLSRAVTPRKPPGSEKDREHTNRETSAVRLRIHSRFQELRPRQSALNSPPCSLHFGEQSPSSRASAFEHEECCTTGAAHRLKLAEPDISGEF